MKSQASLEANRRYYEKNKDRIRERERQRRLENPEKARERSRKSAKAHYWRNREKCLEYHKARFLAKKDEPEFIEKRRESSKKHYWENREKYLALHREYHANNKEKRSVYGRMFHYKKKFGITIAERDALFAANDGLCHVCSKVPSECVDHDHDTGRIRGALCAPCNTMLGCAKDNPETLLLAADYLRRETCVIS